MSGTIRYKLNCLTNDASNFHNNQAMFVSLYQYFQLQVASGQAAIHASNFGDSISDLEATGFDYWDGANSAGENAWFVVRMLASASTVRTNDYYLLFQWADAFAFGASSGAPGTLTNSTGDGVGVAMAYRTDGGDPWAGTTNADGTDTKGTPVWTAGGSTLVMFTTRNESGTRATNKEDLERIADFTGTHRMHVLGDADGTFIYADGSSDGDSEAYLYIGAYEPIPNATIENPLVHMQFIGGGVPAPGGIFDTTGNYEGLMVGSDPTAGPQTYNVSGAIEGATDTSTNQPSIQGGVTQYVEWPIFINQRSGPDIGVAGVLVAQLIGYIFNVPGNDTNAAVTRAFLPGASTQLSRKFSTAWAGGLQPGSGSSKEGTEV